MTAGADPDLAPMRWWHIPAALALEPVLFPGHPWTAAAFWSELAQRDARHYVVAQVDRRLVGYAGTALLGDEAWVQTIGVAPDWQGRGVGHRLLAELGNAAARWRVAGCWLEVREDNLRAQRMYARAGFAVVGRRPRYYPDGAHALVMHRAGHPGGAAPAGR